MVLKGVDEITGPFISMVRLAEFLWLDFVAPRPLAPRVRLMQKKLHMGIEAREASAH